MIKLYCIICGKQENFKHVKHHTTYKKKIVFSIICSKCKNEDDIYLKKKNQLRIIKNSWFNRKYIITLKIWLKKT